MCETAAASCHRHDISDRAWNILAPMLPGGPGKVGRPAQDSRRFINVVFRVLRTGTPWRDLPPDYGDGCAVHRRFSRSGNPFIGTVAGCAVHRRFSRWRQKGAGPNRWKR